MNPAVAVFLGWAFVGEHVGGREIAAGLVILSSVAPAPPSPVTRATQPEPTAESLPFYIREQEARTRREFPRSVPRLSELYRIAA